MVYSDTTNLDGIIQIYEKLTDVGYAYVSGDTTRLKEATALANNKSHFVWDIIHNATGNWQYDDNNNTDLPFATTDLVSGQSRYALPSEALTVQRVEIKDQSGLWTVIYPFVKESVNQALDEFLKDDSIPMVYRLVNGVIELYPATNYASSDGLKVYYDREAVEFATDDTTQTPGFASPYHEILPILMAIDWYEVKQPQSATLQLLREKELKLEQMITRFYGKRFKDYKPRVGRAKNSYR